MNPQKLFVLQIMADNKGEIKAYKKLNIGKKGEISGVLLNLWHLSSRKV